MSLEYDDYLQQHISNVVNAYEWLVRNITGASMFGVGQNYVLDHDESKFTSHEYDPYDEYFYGDRKTKEINNNFNYAWLHHIHNNKHHWQYWVLINDDPEEGTIALDIPYKYVLEMIADWWSFSWKSGNLYEIFDWYDSHKAHMILSKNTRETVEEILSEMKEKLDSEKIGGM